MQKAINDSLMMAGARQQVPAAGRQDIDADMAAAIAASMNDF